jgi:hypothetical protein
MQTNRSLVVLSAIVVLTGCTQEVGPPPPPSAEAGLKEMASVYKYLDYSKLPPPRKPEDFDNYIDTMPTALTRIKEGEYVVAFGVGHASGPGAGSQILAYEKKAPAEGGAVLLRDGTVKQVTAAEFSSAGVAK